MPNTIRKVSYAYVTAASKPGEAARILQALRDANVNLLAFSGFPQGRNKAQIDVVTDDLDALKGVARGRIVVNERGGSRRGHPMGEVVDSRREGDHPPGSTAGQMPAIRAAQVPGGVAAHWNGRSRSTVHAGVVGGGYVRIVQRDLGILVGPVQSREEAVFGQRPAEPAARARVGGRASVLDEP